METVLFYAPELYFSDNAFREFIDDSIEANSKEETLILLKEKYPEHTFVYLYIYSNDSLSVSDIKKDNVVSYGFAGYLNNKSDLDDLMFYVNRYEKNTDADIIEDDIIEVIPDNKDTFVDNIILDYDYD